MPIRITPRRSVTIDTREATTDDLLRVELSNNKTYYLRAEVPSPEAGHQYWFDYEFMPEDLKEAARFAIKTEFELKNQEDHGYSVSTSVYKPTQVEIDQELMLTTSSYVLDELDYDLGLTVKIKYATTKLRQWSGGGHVIHIEPVTLEQARAELAATL